LLKKHPQFRQDLRLNLVGPMDRSVIATLENFPLLRSCLQTTEWLEHHEAIRRMRESRVLLLLLNDTPNTRGLLPGKLFEYLGTGRPVLCIGAEDGDAAQIIRDSADGITVDLNQEKKIEESISALYQDYLKGSLPSAGVSPSVARYARRNIVETYAALMKEVIETPIAVRHKKQPS
jgi:hypothetical protein